jgi:hypothetical protein
MGTKWGHRFISHHHNHTIDHDWLFSDMEWDNHTAYDFDNDGLNNLEEYRTSQWGSDPYRKDVFVELDQMAPSPDGFESKLPEGQKELLKTVFDRRNVVWHLDDGCMGRYDVIPFQSLVNDTILDEEIYWNYFLHKDAENWRKGVFHYDIVVYRADFPGHGFRSNAWQISAYPLEQNEIRASPL